MKNLAQFLGGLTLTLSTNTLAYAENPTRGPEAQIIPPANVQQTLLLDMPAMPVITGPSGHDAHGPVDLGWDMRQGQNGNQWSLIEDGHIIATQSIARQSPMPQSGKIALHKTPGTYNYQINLCNVQNGQKSCNMSLVKTITVRPMGIVPINKRH